MIRQRRPWLREEIEILLTHCTATTLIPFYKQHMIKKTSWTFLDLIQSLLIFVASFMRENALSLLKKIKSFHTI